MLSNFIFLKPLNSPAIQSILLLCPPVSDNMPWASAKRDCEVWMLHRDVRSCGGNHLVPVLFHSHPVLRSEAASGSSVAQLHASLSPCQTPLAGTARGASQLLLVHAGSEADGSAHGKCWQEREQPQDQLVGPSCHCCQWLLRTQGSDSSLQQTEHRLLASGASSSC